MTVLSLRHRLEWVLLGIALCTPCIWLAYRLALSGDKTSGLASYIVAILGIFALRQFIFVPPRISLRRWWRRSTQPGYYAVPQSGGPIRIIRNVFVDFSEIYDLKGDLLGHEQDIWSDNCWTFKPVKYKKKMPPIALWRTRRRKPQNMR